MFIAIFVNFNYFNEKYESQEMAIERFISIQNLIHRRFHFIVSVKFLVMSVCPSYKYFQFQLFPVALNFYFCTLYLFIIVNE